jgi:hypothetical protein
MSSESTDEVEEVSSSQGQAKRKKTQVLENIVRLINLNRCVIVKTL